GKAEFWYRKAMAQKATGAWAEGKLAGAAGKAGYFNQNSDARIAEFNLTQLYYYNDKNLSEALRMINNVIQESAGSSIFFCCEFAGGRYFTQKQFVELKEKIEKKLNGK
ncbi:MAG TPA: sel1 repeat family protein, partial [Nitrospirota bacterium]|nr:sel1 repeat family protein [Nitrospirota bacterium]